MSSAPLEPAGPADRRTNRSLVVVSVGTDHHRFDRLVQWMDGWALGNRAVRVVVQRGSAEPTRSAESQPLVPHGELCALFAEATAVVVHGGPSTVMDARAAGRLPIVMPRDPDRGEHVDDHQLRFADHLSRHGLARVVRARDELLAAIGEAIADPSAFRVADDAQPPPGIVGFGRVLDELLGAATPLRNDWLAPGDVEVGR